MSAMCNSQVVFFTLLVSEKGNVISPVCLSVCYGHSHGYLTYDLDFLSRLQRSSLHLSQQVMGFAGKTAFVPIHMM